MREDKSTQEARNFINDVFIEAVRRKHGKREKSFMAPIDLTSGGTNNLDRFTDFIPPNEHETSYSMRTEDAINEVGALFAGQVQELCNVYYNLETHALKMIRDYYDQNQMNIVQNAIVEHTMMAQYLMISVIDDTSKMSNAFHDISHTPGSNRILNYLTSKHGYTIRAEQLTIHFLVQDLAQTYINCITEHGLRTDMVTMSQFTYQLGLLAENVAEVLVVLNDTYNSSD